MPKIPTELIFPQTNTPSQPDLSAISPIPLATQLTHNTVTAILTVAILALLTTITLATLRHLRWISPCQQLYLTRTTRILVGALLLLAITLPTIALNMPTT